MTYKEDNEERERLQTVSYIEYNETKRRWESPKCLVCGQKHRRFNGYTSEFAKYCSNKCKQKAYRKRLKELTKV